MDSPARSPVARSSTRGPPAVLIRAPLSSPEEEDDVDPMAASSSSPSSPSSPPSASSEEQEERFLSGEDEPEPEFDTASERPFVIDADEEGSPEDDLFLPQAVPPAFLRRKPPTAMPKAWVSQEEDDVAEEVFDDGLMADVDEEALQVQVVRVAPPPPSGGEREGEEDTGSAGGEGVLEEDREDDGEKEAEGAGVSEEVGMGGAFGGDTNPEVSTDAYEEKEMMERSVVISASTDEEPVPVAVGEEVGEDGMLQENPVTDGGTVAELPVLMGSGGVSATLVNENVGEDAAGGENVDMGDGQGAALDAEVVGGSEVVEQSSLGFVDGNGEKTVLDGECKDVEGLGNAAEEETYRVTVVAPDVGPDEAKSVASTEPNGAFSGSRSDNNPETASTVTVESHELQPSETKENMGNTEEEEGRAADSTEIKGGVGLAEENGTLKMVNTSVDSGDAECSLHNAEHLDNAVFADKSVPTESKTERDETEEALLIGTGEERNTVTLVKEASSENTAEESGIHSDFGSLDNPGKISVGNVETQNSQPVETKDIIWHTEGEDNDAQGLVHVSVESDEGIPLEPKKEGGEIGQPSAELQGSSEEAKLKIEVSDSDVHSDAEISPTILAEDPVNERPASEVAMAWEVADNGSSVISITDSDPKRISDISEDTDDEGQHMDLNEGEKTGLVADEDIKIALWGKSRTDEQVLKELEEGSSGSSSRFESSRDYSSHMDGQIVTDSDEEMETDQERDGKELFDSAALSALLKAVTGASSDGTVSITAPDTSRLFSGERPAGLGSSGTSLNPAASRTTRPNLFSPSDLAVVGEPESNIDEEEKKLQEKVDQIRVKFLRLVHRLGHSPEDRVAMQVLYRLGLAEGIKRGRQIGRTFSFENAKRRALQLEENEKETLDFSCNILVIGKTGVGKSATINSIFGEEKVVTDAFDPVTTSVREIIGTVDGVKLRVIDTPGLKPSVMDQTANKRTLASILKYTKRCPPDIVLYVDRLDTLTWDLNDLPLLRSITSSLGASIWFNAIIALTHAASSPPDGPSGSPLSYERFVDQRSHGVQHAIRQASGDMRFMNPVALVENHLSCRRNGEGQRVLPNGVSWRTQILLLCYSSKILSDANSLLKLQDSSPGKLFGFRARSPPLPFLLSSLLQSRVHPKLSAEQGVDNGDSDFDMGDFSNPEQEEEEDEYDQLPPFKPLRKAQIAKLTKEQRKAYFDEYDYRVKLLQKKQWKEELKRLKEMKKREKAGKDESDYGDMMDDYDQDVAPATVPVPLPDMVLPPSFDCDNPAYRYRFLEPTSQLVVRPVLDTHGWDHDCGYDGVSLEENLAVASRFPAGLSVQITKDKKDFNIHLESALSAKHGENGSTLAGFDIQSVGRQLAYILRSETKFRNLKKNKTAAGVSVTFLGENIATGLKVEDQLMVGKRLGLVANAGAVRAQGDVAYGANLEMHLREDFPIGQDVSTLGLSLMKWRNDLALGANLQSQFSVGRNMKMAVRIGLNNKLSGQITVRTSTSEQLQIALMGILPLAVSIYRSIWCGET